MEGLNLVFPAVVTALFLFPVAFIVYVNAGGSYRALQYFLGERKANKLEETSSSLCSIDDDCPSGYVCVNGRCMPARF